MAKSSRSGFSLVEVMVAVGLLSIVGMGLAAMFQVMSKGLQTVNETQDIQGVVNSVNSILQKNDVCAQALIGVPLEPAFAASDSNNPIALSEITAPMMGAGGPISIAKAGSKISNLSHITVSQITLSNGGQLKNAMNAASTLEQRDSLGALHIYKIYVGTLNVFFQKNQAANQSYGPADFKPRSFTLTLGFDQATQQLGICNADSATAQVCQSYFNGAFNSANASPQCHIPQILSDNDFSIYTNTNALLPSVKVIGSSGNVGIGTGTPTVTLDVAGGVRPGSSTIVTACGPGQANGEGTTRYNYGTHLMEYCNGTGWMVMSGGHGSCITVGGASQGMWYSDGAMPTCPAGYTMNGIQTWGGCSGGVCGSNIVCCK